MTKETFIEKLLEKGYVQENPNYYSRCWGKSGGDMEYVFTHHLTYSKEHSDPDEEGWTVQCADFEELSDWAF